MNTLNKVTLIGNIGQSPKVFEFEGGKLVSFSLATHETWKDKLGNTHQETEWHNIVVFNERFLNLVEKHLSKGDLVYVEGQIKSNHWKSQEGQAQKSYEIVIPKFGGELKLLVRKTASTSQSS